MSFQLIGWKKDSFSWRKSWKAGKKILFHGEKAGKRAFSPKKAGILYFALMDTLHKHIVIWSKPYNSEHLLSQISNNFLDHFSANII